MTRDLSKLSVDELRDVLTGYLMADERPKPLDKPDYKQLITVCEAYLDELIENQIRDSDMPHYIYEAAMKAIYGHGIFDWINQWLE